MVKISKEHVEDLWHACNQLDEIKVALLGLGALFEQQNHEIPYENEELRGVGQILKYLGKQASEAEHLLKQTLDD